MHMQEFDLVGKLLIAFVAQRFLLEKKATRVAMH